jgi:hypothetical protein
MKIAFACPSYGPIDAKVAHSQRHAIMMAWANGIEVHGDSWIDRAGWDTARNRIAYNFLENGEGFDGIFWCDSDTVLTPDAIVKLCIPEVDVCTGIYYGRHPPFEPQIHVYNEHVDAWNRILQWPANDIFPVHGHGFGCVYTSRRALELTQQIDFDGPPGLSSDGTVVPLERRWWFRTGKWGEDLTWCHHARKMGLILWCNPQVEVGHLGMAHEISRADFKKYYDDNQTEARMAAMTLRRNDDGTYEAKILDGLGPTVDGQGTTPGTHHSVGLDEHLRMTPSA